MKKEIILACLIASIAIIVYLPSLQNGFVNWDDEAYVVDNQAIRSLDISLLKWAFFRFYASNWHPLTWISHALDYAAWGLNPFGHHLTNVVFHGLNTFLVVFLTVRLLVIGRRKPACDNNGEVPLEKDFVLLPAAVVGLLFGIHPIHIESVAWISERKDLLYAFFFLLGLLSYVRYLETTLEQDRQMPASKIYYLATLVFFTFSLMSKPMAITLPAVLLILDWYLLAKFQERKNAKTVILEKVPFFLLSLFSCIVTLSAQTSESFRVASVEQLPLLTRILVAFKAIFLYIKNFFIPLNLIPLYRYPQGVSFLSFEYLFSVLLFVGITGYCIFSMKKRRVLLAAWAFYLVTLLPVLGIVQVGRQPMADRYVYLAFLGPTILIGVFVEYVYERLGRLSGYKRLLRTVLSVCLIAALGGLSLISVKQVHIWKDGVTLWTYEINAEPRFPEAYQRRGNAYRKQGNFEEAIKDYTTAISLDPFSEPNYYNDRGISYANLGLIKEALRDFDTAIYISPDESTYHRNRENALRDMEHVN